MRVAVIQPYFLPYIGYWQLIHAADLFILGDDFQYIKRGWINRNRFLRQDGGWFYVTMPLQKHDMYECIKNVELQAQVDIRQLLANALIQYRCRGRTPYFDEIYDLMMHAADLATSRNISCVNEVFIKVICAYLGITTEIKIMSECDLVQEDDLNACERMVRLCQQMGASEFCNPVGGQHLYDKDQFRKQGMNLSFLRSNEIIYQQHNKFEPALSIVDVLMFNGQSGTRALLDSYSILQAE
jgi:hypothetical protein